MGFASPHLLLVTDPNQSPGEKFWNKSSRIKHPRVDQGPGNCLDASSPEGSRRMGPDSLASCTRDQVQAVCQASTKRSEAASRDRGAAGVRENLALGGERQRRSLHPPCHSENNWPCSP